MVFSNKEKLLIIGAVVLVLIVAIALFYINSGKQSKQQSLKQTKSSATASAITGASSKTATVAKGSAPTGPSFNNPQLVPPGQLPDNGKKFVIASVSTGKYLSDAGVLTNDINSARVFTYNSSVGHTNESISNANTSDGTPYTQLIINFSGQNALVGPLDTICSSNNAAAYGIMLGLNAWDYGSVQCNVAAALEEAYLPVYGAKFYYV